MFKHPFAALKVKLIAKKCYRIYNNNSIKTELDSFVSGGQLDAFRHSFFMAAFSQKIKPRKVKQLGIAHEKGNYRDFLKERDEDGERIDSLGCEMDLKNNDLGIKIGRENRKLTLAELKTKMISEIKAGNAFILKRNPKGDYVYCDGKPIDMETYLKTWYIPKCLVKSNELP